MLVGGGATGLVRWLKRDRPVAGTVPTPSGGGGTIPTPDTLRKKQVVIILPAEFAHGEFTCATDALKQREIAVLTAGPEKKPLDAFQYTPSGKNYVKKYEPEYALRDLSNAILDSVDGIMFMPGEAKSLLPKGAAGPEVKRIVEYAIQKKKLVGAIGSGVVILGLHGFLENREVTSIANRPKSEEKITVKRWVDDPKVVIDLPFITCGQLQNTRELTDELAKAIQAPKR